MLDGEKMREIIENELLREIRGYMQNDEGDVRVVEMRPQSHVTLKVSGGCAQCSTNKDILHYSIRQAIKRRFSHLQVEIVEEEIT